MDGLANRFVQLQGLQESLLKQIREFKQSGDPTKLPDIVEANRLDDELQDLARELDAPSDTSPSNARRRRSQVNHQFTFVADSNSVRPEPSLFSVSEHPKSSLTSSRRSSLTPPAASSFSVTSRGSSVVQQPSPVATVTPVLSQTPRTQTITPTVPSVPQSVAAPSEAPTPPLILSETDPVAIDLLSPSSRLRRRQIDSFQIPHIPTPSEPVDVSDSVSQTESVHMLPVQPSPPISSFGEFMKAFAQPPSELSSELSISEINDLPSVETLQEAPPITRSPRRSTIGHNINYQIPENQRVVYEPEKFSSKSTPVEQSSVVDQVKDAFSGIVESLAQDANSSSASQAPQAPPPLPIPPTPQKNFSIIETPKKRNQSLRSPSPLRDSNRRRSAFGKSSNDCTDSKFWESVHQQRIKAEKITATVAAITALLDAHRKDSGKIRVKKFGILGEYLFQKQREYIEKGGNPPLESLGNESPSNQPPRPQPTMFDTVRAVLLIQRYFRRFVNRRRERIEAVKSLAATEANDSRDKLRKRRLERKAAREDSMGVN